MSNSESSSDSTSEFQENNDSTSGSSEDVNGATNSDKEEEEAEERKEPVSVKPKTRLSSPESGYLVYLFSGDQNPAEIAVLRKICMKYGLQAWDEMVKYIPWRNRAAFRTTLCHIIRKQALSEYDGIKADPFEIQKDNRLDTNSVSEDYTVKGGMLINQKWDRSNSEWEEMRVANMQKYSISDNEAEQIEIPIIMSIEYLKQMGNNRKQSLLLKRAALRSEAQKRGLAHFDNFGVADLCLQPSEALTLPPNGEELQIASDPNEGFYKIEE